LQFHASPIVECVATVGRPCTNGPMQKFISRPTIAALTHTHRM